MKKAILLSAIVVILTLVVACDPSLWPRTALERIAAFIADASESPQDTSSLQSHFLSDLTQFDPMLDPAYWDARYFNETEGPFTLTDTMDAGEGDYGVTSVKYTATVTNGFAVPDAVEFHLLPDPNLDGNFLIRKIVTDPGGAGEQIIENRM